MKRCLNLGCGDRPKASTADEQWTNLDAQDKIGVDVVADLRRGLPFANESFQHVLVDNLIEHLRSEDAIHLINEIDRVLVVGGTCTIIVPDGRSQGGLQDPTHLSWWVPRSALYLNQVQSAYGGKFIGITANLIASNIRTWGDRETEEFICFELVKKP